VKISEMQDRAHENAKAKGWWDEERTPAECLALIHSEVSEALECLREHDPEYVYLRQDDRKPEGFIYEIADVLIRCADLCGRLDLDLQEAVMMKMAYNLRRPHRHGGKRL
jgi:NTP pyrophosphatase (non-canonical NTP hydrolase)